MVTYQNILDVIMLETGQYISDLQATLLDQTKLELLIKKELGLYSRYRPNKVTRVDTLYNGKIYTMEHDNIIPNAITDIRTDRFNTMGINLTPIPGPVHCYHWNYTKPTLYFRYPEGQYIVSYIVDHVYDETTDKIESIELHDKFMNLIVGRFMQTVGRSRRAFTVDEIPINTDASEMISEGKEIYDSALEEIKINSAFNLAVLI